MTENKWIAVEQTERYQDRSGREDSAKRREQLLKNTLLEQKIRIANVTATAREQKLETDADRDADNERIATDAIENANLEILERYHSQIARFFILGSGLVFAFCIGGLALFAIVIVLGMLSAIVGLPI